LLSYFLQIYASCLESALLDLAEGDAEQNWEVDGTAIEPFQIFFSDFVGIIIAFAFDECLGECQTDFPFVGALSTQ